MSSYYGRPIVKPHVWTPYIPAYFWIGGVAGAASVHAAIARARSQERLANVQSIAAFVGISIAPVLLIADLGVPGRFLHMLRVFKPTSPMSVGTWVVLAFAGCITTANGARVFGFRPVARVAEVFAAMLGPVLSTYTAVLIADTATPAWHEAYPVMPFLFVSSAMAGAGSIGCAFAPLDETGSAHRMMIAGALAMSGAGTVLERDLGPLLSTPYRDGAAGRLKRISMVLGLGGALIGAVARKHRTAMRIAAVAVAAAGIVERYAILEAGKQSARDPRYVVEPQRERLIGMGPEQT